MNNNKLIIIAEAGVNHNGSLKKAYKLVEAAKYAGADYVKFQVFSPENLCIKDAKKANYQKKFNPKENQYQMLKKLSLKEKDFIRLKLFCKKKKIKFLLSVFDLNGLKIIKRTGLKILKLPSGEINNTPLLKEIGKLNYKTIISTGMSTTNEIHYCVNFLKKNGLKKNKISILHCNTEYPTPLKDINLKVILTLRKKFNCNVGISDHSTSIVAPSLAVALGAKIIEKHLTLNKKSKGPDHFASLDPKEFREMVINVKNTHTILGSSKKKITSSEKKNLKIVRKSIVASCEIKKNEIFSEKNLTTKRPADGISSRLWNKVLGKKAKKNFYKDEFIKI